MRKSVWQPCLLAHWTSNKCGDFEHPGRGRGGRNLEAGNRGAVMNRRTPVQPSPSFCDQENLGPQLQSTGTVFIQFTRGKNVADKVFQQRECFFYALGLPTWVIEPQTWVWSNAATTNGPLLTSCLANSPFQSQFSHLWHRDNNAFLPQSVGAKLKWYNAHKVSLVPEVF